MYTRHEWWRDCDGVKSISVKLMSCPGLTETVQARPTSLPHDDADNGRAGALFGRRADRYIDALLTSERRWHVPSLAALTTVNHSHNHTQLYNSKSKPIRTCSTAMHYILLSYRSNTSYDGQMWFVIHVAIRPHTSRNLLSRTVHPCGHVNDTRHRRTGLISSSDLTKLDVPPTRTTFGDRSFVVHGPRVWNSLYQRQVATRHYNWHFLAADSSLICSFHRLLKLRTDGGQSRVRELGTWVHRFCNVSDDRCPAPIHSIIRTSNLASMFPGTIWTWPLKNFSKRGRGQGNVTPKFLENMC